MGTGLNPSKSITRIKWAQAILKSASVTIAAAPNNPQYFHCASPGFAVYKRTTATA